MSMSFLTMSVNTEYLHSELNQWFRPREDHHSSYFKTIMTSPERNTPIAASQGIKHRV